MLCFFQAEDGIRDIGVTGVQTCALPIFEAAAFDTLAQGEVLVAPYTSPAWTALFQRAAAVVADSGGPASHAAIVAREYGIRSEERRVGKEGRSRWWPYHLKKQSMRPALR